MNKNEKMKTVAISEVITRFNGGGFYDISGDMVNGGKRDETGKWIPNIYKSEITRRINSVNLEKQKLYCECGREFLINNNLKLIKCDY